MKTLLILASVLLVGCVTPPAATPIYIPVPSPRNVAPLDSELSKPCALPPFDATDDYDAWQNYFNAVLESFAGCANRFHRVIDIYNAEVQKNAPVPVPAVPAPVPGTPTPAPTWPAIRSSGN